MKHQILFLNHQQRHRVASNAVGTSMNVLKKRRMLLNVKLQVRFGKSVICKKAMWDKLVRRCHTSVNVANERQVLKTQPLKQSIMLDTQVMLSIMVRNTTDFIDAPDVVLGWWMVPMPSIQR